MNWDCHCIGKVDAVGDDLFIEFVVLDPTCPFHN